MTITSTRPRLAVVRPAGGGPACTSGLPWCTGDRNTHDLELLHEGESVYHDSPPVDLPMTGGDDRTCNGFTVSLERQDSLDGAAGRTRVYMAPISDRAPMPRGGYATLDEAESIARVILAHVLNARAPRPDLSAAAQSGQWPYGAEALAALRRLSARQRIAMSLRYVDGLSLGETAAAMGVRPDKIKVYIARAKAQLRTWGVLDASTALDGAA
ncbi:sigma-70 family RNA polymerase sigma factor [Dactylosporangium sp. NPDC051484]|uniref:sigma-70 family RNA polymerase sigma factor n=1 Tax=Dactylosporangium sp. NPDC051484 TaxID=3154942 RepID=UPI00344BC2B0